MRRPYFTVLLISSLFLITSCGDDQGFITPVPTPTAYTTVVNVIPDSPILTVFGNQILIDQVQYTHATSLTPTLPQVPREYSVLQNAENTNSGEQVIEVIVTIEISHLATIVLTGMMDAIVPVIIDSAPAEFEAGSTSTGVVFVNGSSSMDTVTIALFGPDVDTVTLSLPASEQSELITTTASDQHRIVVRDPDGNLLWESGEFSMVPQANHLFVLADYFGPGTNSVQMFAVNNPAQFPNEQLETSVRLANMIPDHGPVDIAADSVSIATNLSFGESTEYLALDTGLTTFTLTTFGDPSEELFVGSRALRAGNFYTHGFAGLGGVLDSSFGIDDRRRIAARSKISITKLAPSTGIVDVYITQPGVNVGDTPPIARLDETEITGFETFPGSLNFSVTTVGSTDIIYGPQRIDLEPNGIYSIILTDPSGGGEPLEVLYLDDFIQ